MAGLELEWEGSETVRSTFGRWSGVYGGVRPPARLGSYLHWVKYIGSSALCSTSQTLPRASQPELRSAQSREKGSNWPSFLDLEIVVIGCIAASR